MRRLTVQWRSVLCAAFFGLLLSWSFQECVAAAVEADKVTSDSHSSALVPPQAIRDGAQRRQDARRAWIGAEATPEYRQYLMQLADTEPAPKTAKPAAQKALRASGSGGTNPLWVNLGPTRAAYEINGAVMPGAIDSGRVAAIVVHPSLANIIYVASAEGGVWKTTDGGGIWSPITDNLPSLSVGSSYSLDKACL